MKKIMFLFLLMWNQFAVCQCDIGDILMFEMSSSKFDIMNIINQSTVVKIPNDDLSKILVRANSGWKKYDYLKDSVFVYIINAKHLKDDCYKSENNRIQLSLCDDVLYKVAISQEFKKEDYNVMIEEYEKLVEIFDKSFSYSNQILTTNKNKEKIGEGFKFYDFPKEKRDPIKIQNAEVSYRIIYDYEYNYDIDYYQLEIEWVDLKPTKLTNKGY